MTLPAHEKELGIVPHPCGATSAEARNWQKTIQALGRYNIRRFRLTADLALGGSAAANLYRWETDAYVFVRAITVHCADPPPDSWQGSSGDYGWCTPRGQSVDDYDIVWMDTTPVPPDPQDPERHLANIYFCPLGCTPSRAWLLLTAAQLSALDPTGPNSIQFPTNNALTFVGMYLVKSEKVRNPDPGQDPDTRLVEFADARWIASLNSDTESINANIRSYAQSNAYLTGTDGVTWTSLAESLWDACGVLGAYPGLPFAPDAQPENTRFIGLNAFSSLCALLEQLDCAVCHNPLTGVYTIVQLGAAQTIPGEAGSLLWNASPGTYGANRTAATVRVYFHNCYRSYGQERDTSLTNNWSYIGAGSWIDVATAVTDAIGEVALWDDLARVLDEDNNLSNGAALTTRATARKNRYVTRQAVTNVHRVHSGMLSTILPAGQVRATLWRDADTGSGQITEFIACAPLISDVQLREDGCCLCVPSDTVSPKKEHYATPDLGRHSYPNYPRLPNIVRVYDSGAAAGALIDPNAAGLHLGIVQRYVAGTVAAQEDCWILFVDDYANVAGQVKAVNGEYYGPARLSGIRLSDGTTKPVYVVRRGDMDRVRRFRLTGNLSTGGEQTAKIRLWNGTAYVDGTDITVVDWWGVSGGGRGMFQGVTNFEGWCIRREAGTKYDIVWMEQYAFAVEFTLTSTWSGGAASATVTASWHQGIDPGATITVHDDQTRFQDAIVGCKGIAWRSEYAGGPTPPYYKVVSCQRACILASATAYTNSCGGNEIEIDSFTPHSVGDYVVDPGAPASALCTVTHAVQAGDSITIARITNNPPFDWIVIDVDKKPFYNVCRSPSNHATHANVYSRISGGKLQVYVQRQYVETCDVGEFVDLRALKDCEGNAPANTPNDT